MCDVLSVWLYLVPARPMTQGSNIAIAKTFYQIKNGVYRTLTYKTPGNEGTYKQLGPQSESCLCV